MFLSNQTDSLNKEFSRLNVTDTYLNKTSGVQRHQMFTDITKKTLHTIPFKFTDGNVELGQCDYIYDLNHIPGNVDIVLPKVKNIMNWVVLWYEQQKTVYNVSYDNHSKIKIYGNGSRIMGLNEPLVCDMPFMSLRLTFVNDIDGWIVT